jgi:hypothetical protein
LRLGPLAKHYEHRERNCSMALEFTVHGLAIPESPQGRGREERLRKRLDSPRLRKLAL